MLSAMLMVGILASIALPRLRGPVADADAAKIYGDFRAFRQAAFDFLDEQGRFPKGGSMGQVPAELKGEVPDFKYKGIGYTWISADLRGTGSNVWGGRHLGIFMITFGSEHADIAESMKDRPVGMAGRFRDYYWSPKQVMFVMME